MKYCSKCGKELTVTDSRVRKDGYVHRVRDCKKCWTRIYTIELPLEEYTNVIDENKSIKTLIGKVKEML